MLVGIESSIRKSVRIFVEIAQEHHYVLPDYLQQSAEEARKRFLGRFASNR